MGTKGRAPHLRHKSLYPHFHFHWAGLYLASPLDILYRGSSRVIIPHQRLLIRVKKNVDQSQQTFRPGKCTLDLEKRSGKGEDLTVLEQTTQF